MNPNGSFYWLQQDHLGSGRKLTDAAGNMVYRAEFDPYGKLLYEWSSPSNLNSRKFTGYERDAATNLDYAQARMYSSDWGRFMSPDPAGMSSVSLTRPKSLNRYAYVEGNPVNAIDPAGANIWGWIKGFFGGVFGGNGAGAGFLANDDNDWDWFYWQLPQWIDAPYLPNPEPTEPEPVVETCTITLIARSPAGIAGWIADYYHLFIVVKGSNEAQGIFYRGAPENLTSNPFADPGDLLGTHGNYGPRGYEYEAVQKTGIRASDKVDIPGDCSQINSALLAAENKLNAANLPYQYPTNLQPINEINNSNAYAYTLLKALDFTGYNPAQTLGSSVLKQIPIDPLSKYNGLGFNPFVIGWGYKLPI